MIYVRASANYVGERHAYLTALALFTGGTALCALAWNPLSLTAFAAIQGLGAGLLLYAGPDLIGDEFPRDQQGRIFIAFLVLAVLLILTHPLQQFDWRVTFLFNIPFGLL